MSKIAIVTDSTADLNAEMIQHHNITVVPLNVHFDEEVYKDGVDLTPDEFFVKLEGSPVPPRTSQPSPGDFHQVYNTLLSQGYTGIISIHISKELSGTWQSACIARDMLPQADIQIVDSKSASLGVGLIVLNTAKLIQKGASLDEAANYARRLVHSQKVMFGVATLEYLHRNGRIGRAAKLMGELLNVKPILHIDEDGFVAALGKIRGKNKFVPYLMEQAEKYLAGYDRPVDAAVAHAQDPELAAQLADNIRSRLNVRNLYISELGTVICTHTGPGTVGMIIQKFDLPMPGNLSTIAAKGGLENE